MITYQTLPELERAIVTLQTDIRHAKALLRLKETELLVLTQTRRKLHLRHIGLKPGDYLVITAQSRNHVFGNKNACFIIGDIVAIESYYPADSTGTIVELDRAPSSQADIPLVVIQEMRQAYLDKHGD